MLPSLSVSDESWSTLPSTLIRLPRSLTLPRPFKRFVTWPMLPSLSVSDESWSTLPKTLTKSLKLCTSPRVWNRATVPPIPPAPESSLPKSPEPREEKSDAALSEPSALTNPSMPPAPYASTSVAYSPSPIMLANVVTSGDSTRPSTIPTLEIPEFATVERMPAVPVAAIIDLSDVTPTSPSNVSNCDCPSLLRSSAISEEEASLNKSEIPPEPIAFERLSKPLSPNIELALLKSPAMSVLLPPAAPSAIDSIPFVPSVSKKEVSVSLPLVVRSVLKFEYPRSVTALANASSPMFCTISIRFPVPVFARRSLKFVKPNLETSVVNVSAPSVVISVFVSETPALTMSVLKFEYPILTMVSASVSAPTLMVSAMKSSGPMVLMRSTVLSSPTVFVKFPNAAPVIFVTILLKFVLPISFKNLLTPEVPIATMRSLTFVTAV